MSSGDFGLFCCICFEGLTAETAVIDEEGSMWDICKGQCAIDAGIKEKHETSSD